jgi:hypothetical protein
MTGRRTGIIALLGLLLAGLLLGGSQLLRAEPAPARVTAPPADALAPGARTPEELARAACVQLRLAAQGLQADSSAPDVRSELAAARVLAAEALRGDARFTQLSGGAAALDEAVRADDPGAAAVGVRVALDACAELS